MNVKVTIDRQKFVEAFDTITFTNGEGRIYTFIPKHFSVDPADYNLTSESGWDGFRQDMILAIRDGMEQVVTDLLYEFVEVEEV